MEQANLRCDTIILSQRPEIEPGKLTVLVFKLLVISLIFAGRGHVSAAV